MGVNIQSKSRRRGGYRPMAEINVTPFVDVMLVLLIIFMVAAPLMTAGVSVDLPNSKAKPIDTQDNAPVEISITKEGLIYIGETQVKQDRLITLLEAMVNRNLDRRVYIRADQSLDYGDVMRILGALNGAGFSKVALISDQSGS